MASSIYPLEDLYAWAPPAPSQVATSSRGQRIEGDAYLSQGSIGNLVVRGNTRVAEHGSIASGMEDFLSGTGFWLEANNGTPRFAVGNPFGDYMSWDGSSLTVAGNATIEGGTIGGWTVNTSDLTGGDAMLNSTGYLRLGTSSNVAIMSSVDPTWRIWAGNASGGSAPFRVDRFGAMTSSTATITGALTSSSLTATGGTIGNWNITSSAIELGSGSTKRGMDSGSTAFYAGSGTPASAPFRVTTAGAMTSSSATITGAVTATSGSLSGLTISGTLTLSGASAKIIDSNTSQWDVNGITLVSTGTFGDAIIWKSGSTTVGSIYNLSTSTMVMAAASSTGAIAVGGSSVSMYSTSTSGTTFLAIDNTPEVNVWLSGNNTASFESTNRRLRTAGYIYPGTGTAMQTTNYMVSHTANIIGVTLGDTAGTNQWQVRDSAGQIQFGVASNGGLIYPDADGTSLGSYAGRIPIFVNSNLRYLAYYN